METFPCICDEYIVKGKTGFCSRQDLPTWKSTVKKCADECRAEMGDFCYFCCPYADPDLSCEGGAKDFMSCPEFNAELNEALGGQFEYWKREIVSTEKGPACLEIYCRVGYAPDVSLELI